jgi:hypothetical protein
LVGGLAAPAGEQRRERLPEGSSGSPRGGEVCEVRGAQCGRRGPDALNGAQHAQRRGRALYLGHAVPHTYLRAAAADPPARRARRAQRRGRVSWDRADCGARERVSDDGGARSKMGRPRANIRGPRGVARPARPLEGAARSAPSKYARARCSGTSEMSRVAELVGTPWLLSARARGTT